MLSGFKDFIFRGNVVDLAVGVVIGAAFGAVVKSFTDAFLTPLIKLATGGGEVGGKFLVNGVAFDYGSFITSVITFLLTALVVYLFVVKPMSHITARFKKPADAAPAGPTQEELLTQIRDELKRRPV